MIGKYLRDVFAVVMVALVWIRDVLARRGPEEMHCIGQFRPQSRSCNKPTPSTACYQSGQSTSLITLIFGINQNLWWK